MTPEQHRQPIKEEKNDRPSHEGTVTLTSPDGRVVEVRDGDVVGRTAVGREVLEIHEEISRRHARFVRSEGTWFVIDLNSSNGTFLEGERLLPKERVRIKDGQRLNFTPIFEAVVKIAEPGNDTLVHPSGDEETACIQQRRKTMTILFADLKGSVDFFQERGTIVARKWILNLYRMLSSIIGAHRGAHVKNIGDAILAVFDDPHEAAKASLEMQADLKEHNRTADEAGRYYLRIGMNMGAVLFEDHDVFGNSVNVASRVQAIAPPEHIFITADLYQAIRDDKDIRCRFIGHEQLKGVKNKTGIYEIIWCGGKNDEGARNIL
ncbi:MAG: adenylate/guanylate cyclase domain-containing protein [Thermodesulfovibrionales bacterium]